MTENLAPESRSLRLALRWITVVSPLVPRAQRGRWLAEWRAELWHAHRTRSGRQRRCLASLPHALSLRLADLRPGALLADLRYAVRQIRRSPGFAVVVTATVALGIGANALVFSILQSTVLQPLPYPDSDRIVYLWRQHPQFQLMVSPRLDDVKEWRERVDAFEELQALSASSYMLAGDPEARRVTGVRVWPDVFALLGATPLLGRTFLPEDVRGQGAPVVVLSHRLWRDRFGADPGVLGKTLRLDDKPYVVVGVMPASLRLQSPMSLTELWLPLTDDTVDVGVTAIARLSAGVGTDAVNAELEALATATEGFDGWIGKVQSPQGMLGEAYRTAVWSFQGAVLLVLLIAGANTANLLLVRGTARRRELAIRAAIGAGRGRLVRQMVFESLLLALAGGLAGLALAVAGVRMLAQVRPDEVRGLETLRVDPVVAIVTFLAALATGVVFGLLPALQTSGGRLLGELAEGSRGTEGGGRSRLRRSLVVAEVALSTLLLVAASLLAHTFVRLQSIDPGFDTAGLVAMRVSLPEYRYPDGPAQQAFWDDLLVEVQRSLGPRATSVALSSGVPPQVGVTFGKIEVEGGAPAAEDSADQEVNAFLSGSVGFIETLGIRLIEGRTFAGDETAESAPVVVISDKLAKRFWPDTSAIGRRIALGGGDDPKWLEVVGVVADIRAFGLVSGLGYGQVYLPSTPGDSLWVVVRSGEDAAGIAATVRSVSRALDSDAPVTDVASVSDMMGSSVSQQAFNALLMSACAGLALLLALVGVYGVLSYSVARRTSELGVRVALGATRRSVVGLVAREGVGLVGIGLGLGALGATWLSGYLSSLLHGLDPADPTSYLVAGVTFLLVGTAACAIPAWRAARVDPMVALRAD